MANIEEIKAFTRYLRYMDIRLYDLTQILIKGETAMPNGATQLLIPIIRVSTTPKSVIRWTRVR